MGDKKPQAKSKAKDSPAEVAGAAGCTRQLADRLLECDRRGRGWLRDALQHLGQQGGISELFGRLLGGICRRASEAGGRWARPNRPRRKVGQGAPGRNRVRVKYTSGARA